MKTVTTTNLRNLRILQWRFRIWKWDEICQQSTQWNCQSHKIQTIDSDTIIVRRQWRRRSGGLAAASNKTTVIRAVLGNKTYLKNMAARALNFFCSTIRWFLRSIYGKLIFKTNYLEETTGSCHDQGIYWEYNTHDTRQQRHVLMKEIPTFINAVTLTMVKYTFYHDPNWKPLL